MKWLIWFAVMFVIALIIRAGRNKPLASGQYRYPPVLTALLVFVGLAWFAFAALVVFSMPDNPTASSGIAAGFGGAGLVSLALAAYVAFERFTANMDSFVYSRLWGSGSFAWREVVKVDYSPMWKMLVIKTQRQRVSLYPALLQNMPELAGLILRRVPDNAIPEKTRGHLLAWEHGALPSVWGG